MVHKLQERHPLNACGANPLTVTLRYRCECAGGEVLSVAAVMDRDAGRERFLRTMGNLWDDVMFEVQQHLTPPAPVDHRGQSDLDKPPELRGYFTEDEIIQRHGIGGADWITAELTRNSRV